MSDRDLLLTATVPGNPRPAPRPHQGQGRSWTPDWYREAKAAVAYALMLRRGLWRPRSEALFAVAIACFRGTRNRADLDNLAKTVLDAGTGVVWADDSQIEELVLRKLLDRANPRTWIRVWVLPGQQVLS